MGYVNVEKLKAKLDRNSIFKKITNAADETVYDMIDSLEEDLEDLIKEYERSKESS